MGRNDRLPTLLTLPLELRQLIYKYAFKDTIIDIGKSSSPSSARNAGILLACRQTHAEALKMYYKHIIFFSPSANRLHWLRHISPTFHAWIEELRVAIDIGEERIMNYSMDDEDVEYRFMWRASFKKQCIETPLANAWGIVLRDGAIKVDVLLENEERIWTSEPENWMPMVWYWADREDVEWEIEEMEFDDGSSIFD